GGTSQRRRSRKRPRSSVKSRHRTADSNSTARLLQRLRRSLSCPTRCVSRLACSTFTSALTRKSLRSSASRRPGSAFERKARRAPRNLEVLDLGQLVQELFRQAVGEVLLIVLRRHVGKREDGDGSALILCSWIRCQNPMGVATDVESSSAARANCSDMPVS